MLLGGILCCDSVSEFGFLFEQMMLHGVCGGTVGSSSDCYDLGIFSSDDSGSDECGSECNDSVCSGSDGSCSNGSGLVGTPIFDVT